MRIYPFQNYQENGLSKFSRDSIFINLSVEDAYTLYAFCKGILDKKITEGELSIKSFNGSVMLVQRVQVEGVYETLITASETDHSVKFLFATREFKKKENGNEVTERIDSQLGAFVKTIEGYLTGINSERHLNKFTDDYVASLPQAERGQQGFGSGYNPNNNNQWKQSYQQSSSRGQSQGWNGNRGRQNNGGGWNNGNNNYRRNNQNGQYNGQQQQGGWGRN